MKKIPFLVTIFLILLLSCQVAFGYTINDNYYGANNHGYGDVIGISAYFDISRMDVNFNNGTLTADIYSRYFDNINIYNNLTQLGDLFISTNGWNPFGSAPYRGDNASNGEAWEYVLVLNDHSTTSGGTLNLYRIADGNIKLSYAPGYIWRDGQEVQFIPTGTPVATAGTWAINGLGTLSDLDDYLRMTINYNNWGVGDSFGFHWTMTCANDVIEGAAPVPEPATIFLMGSGLLGVGIILRKKVLKSKDR